MSKRVTPSPIKKSIKYSVYREFELDFSNELKRLRQCFKGKQLERQLNLIRLFQAGKFNELESAFESLPQCRRDGCSEKEYVGTWLWCYAATVRKDIYHFGESIPVTKLEISFPLGAKPVPIT